jgi:peptide/nickel transport system substrate-binding protein
MRVRRGAPLPPASSALMRQFEKYVMDDQAHELMTLWWYRIVPYRSYVKGWNIGPSHFLGNTLATVWLDK